MRLVIDDVGKGWFDSGGVYLNGIYDLYPRRFNQAPVYTSFVNDGKSAFVSARGLVWTGLAVAPRARALFVKAEQYYIYYS